MGCDVGGEDGEDAPHESDCTVRMTASSSPVHFAETTLESCQKSMVTVAASQSYQVVCDGRQPKRARAALTGALIGEVASDTG